MGASSRRSGLFRALCAGVALTLLAAVAPPPGAAQGAAPATTGSKTKDFLDKYVIDGGALGGALGSMVGAAIMGCVIPGPVGLVAGTFIGGAIGGLIGNWIDDRKGIAVNYTSFKRAPTTQGGLWLEGVGPWEQFLYQVDQWVVNAGGIFSAVTNIGLMTLAKTMPGCALLSPFMIFAFNYAAQVGGDLLDGSVDLGDYGKKMDERRGAAARADAGHNFVYGDATSGSPGGSPGAAPDAPPGARSEAAPALDQTPAGASRDARGAYTTLLERMRTGDQASQRGAFEAYREADGRLRQR